MDDTSAARCDDLLKVYRSVAGEVHALRGITARFRSGEVTAVVGPSGSGKSTLLQLLLALERPTAGQIDVAGTRLADMAFSRRQRWRRRQVGFVFQRPTDNLIPHLTAEEQLRHIAMQRRADVDAAAALLHQVGLEHRAAHRPAQMSGGEQQRLTVTLAVVGRPLIVLADEPTAELDPDSSVTVLGLLRAAARDGAAVVLCSHDPLAIERADRVFALHDGTLTTETVGGESFAVLDGSGRVQLPRAALARFPGARARLVDADGQIVITPP